MVYLLKWLICLVVGSSVTSDKRLIVLALRLDASFAVGAEWLCFLARKMDYFVADIMKSGLEIPVEDESPEPIGLSFKWVHGDVSHLCGAIVERFADATTLTCPLCNCVFQNEGRPRDLLFTHLQEVHFSYEYGCIFRCSTCKSQFATSKNAATHLNTFPKHAVKCSLCRAVLEKSKLRSHFAGQHVIDFCSAIEDELNAAGLDELVEHIKAYAAVRRNNRTITTTDIRRFERTPVRNSERNKSLICGLITEFHCSNDECCLIHQKYKKVYERYCRDGMFRCPMCLKAYINMPAVGIGHLILEHSLQLLTHKYDCTNCEERFGDVFHASEHVSTGHVLFCSICSSYLQDVPSIREHLNRHHSSLIMEVTDRLLRINPERNLVNELTSICYRDGILRCMKCAILLPADAEEFEEHVILYHLGMRPMRCKWCDRPCTEEESKRHVLCCKKIPERETPCFTCNVDNCGSPSDAIGAHFKQTHWNLVKPVILSMLTRARQLYPEWAYILTAYRERVAPMQLMLSTVPPTVVDEQCCQQHWTKSQALLEHILAQHVPLDQPWFIFKASSDPFQRLACSLCEKPVFETTWVCHVLEYHRNLLQDALDKRLSEVLSLCGFDLKFTPIGELPVIKAEIKDEVVLTPMDDLEVLEELPSEEYIDVKSSMNLKKEDTEIKPSFINLEKCCEVSDSIIESNEDDFQQPTGTFQHAKKLPSLSRKERRIVLAYDDVKLTSTPLVMLGSRLDEIIGEIKFSCKQELLSQPNINC